SPANLKPPEPTEAAAVLSVKDEPYTPQRAITLFESYADPDEPNVIGPEGFEKLCTDANLSMEGSAPLILGWQMDAKEMAKISKEEWVSGTKALRISSPKHISTALTDLENLLVYGKSPIKKPKVDSYDRTKYWTYAANPKGAFQKLYLYCFMLVKPPSSKNIEMETAVAFWSVLLGPKYPLMKDILDFINEKGTYRAANKDLWNMMLEFCETINPSLDNFEADGAWPTLLDEFASWKKAKSEA
ncbi:DCN1-like protein 5, partial [Leucoagaricus sp. SymC.cos]